MSDQDILRTRLLDLDSVRERLAATEPLTVHDFTVGDSIRFTLDADLGHGLDATGADEPINASVHLGTSEYQLTKGVLVELASLSGLRPSHALRNPPDLLERHLTYWFRTGLVFGKARKDYRFMVAGDIATALTKQGQQPLSNLRLLEEAVAGIRAYSGADIYADYKFGHSLRRTDLRLIACNTVYLVRDTGAGDDEWSPGVQIHNSLTGNSATIDTYLFRWASTGGAVDKTKSENLVRRHIDDDPHEWASGAVANVLGWSDDAIDAIRHLVHQDVEGSVADVLKDIFLTYRLTVAERTRITAALLDADEVSMYSIMTAISETANRPGLDPGTVDTLMRVAGELPYAAAERCGSCLRIARH